VGFVEKADEKNIRAYALDEKTILERMFLEELRLKIDGLFSYLPKTAVRAVILSPPAHRYDRKNN